MINAEQEYGSHNAKCIETPEKAAVRPSSLSASFPPSDSSAWIRCFFRQVHFIARIPERETQNLLLFKDSLFPSPLMEGLPQPWGEGALEGAPPVPAALLGEGFIALLFFHLSRMGDKPCHFHVFTDVLLLGCSLIHGDERCWINSKLYHLFIYLFCTIINS